MMTDKKKNIATLLQILPALESGGVERGTIEVAKAAKEAGLRSIVMSNGGSLETQLTHAGIEHIHLPVHRKLPWKIYRNARAIRKFIKEEGVDIVHARSRAPAWCGYLATKNTTAIFMTTFHGVYRFKHKCKQWYNSVMTRGKHIIAVSEFIANHITQHYAIDPKDISVIHRGADTKSFDPDNVSSERMVTIAQKIGVNDDYPTILMPGRFSSWKGHAFLLDALAAIPHRNFYCILMGNQQHHEHYVRSLEEKIKTLRLADNVHITSHVNDMPAAYMLADLVVFPSMRPEAFGRISVEAQAMGKLVIATNHGGATESIIPNETGWLVEPHDVKGFAELIDHALSLDEETRDSITRAAHRHVRDYFTKDQMCDKTLQIYQQLLTDAA